MERDKRALRGWKEIENFLGLTRKTIRARGYPIRKFGADNTQVYAYRDELSGHEKGQKEPPAG